MPKVTVIYGQKQEIVEVPADTLVGEAVTLTGLPLEQPCAGRQLCSCLNQALPCQKGWRRKLNKSI